MKSIEFYYDFGSPTAYLAWTQIKKADAENFSIEYIPVLLGGIFKATDNKPPGTVKAKADWMFEDIKMYANSYDVSFAMNAAFPVNTLYLMRGAIFAKKKGILKDYNKAMFSAMWIDNINLNEPKNIINRFKHIVEDAVRSRDLSLSERKKITQSFKDSISGYTYFEK